MSFDITALLDLWTRPRPDRATALADFRRLYTDPVLVNGSALSAEQLVDRAAALQAALDEVHREVLEVCDAGAQVAVAFRLEGRHVGPLATAAGTVPASGRRLSLRVIDILTLTEGRISGITMVADELGALDAVGLVALAT